MHAIFSGAAPMPTLHGSHYSLRPATRFLVPAFWLFENPYTIYTASLVISALLMSTLYFSLYYVLFAPSRYFFPPRDVDRFCHLPLSTPAIARVISHGHENAYVPGFMLLVALLALSCNASHYAPLSSSDCSLAVCTPFTLALYLFYPLLPSYTCVLVFPEYWHGEWLVLH